MNGAIGEIGAEEIWKVPVDRILSRLATSAAGINSAEVQSRLRTFGPNDAAVVKRSPLWLQFLSRFRNPLVSSCSWRADCRLPRATSRAS